MSSKTCSAARQPLFLPTEESVYAYLAPRTRGPRFIETLAFTSHVYGCQPGELHRDLGAQKPHKAPSSAEAVKGVTKCAWASSWMDFRKQAGLHVLEQQCLPTILVVTFSAHVLDSELARNAERQLLVLSA
eukprot:5309172-Amphidinium_carterae.2